jgi:hypothetical protein
MAFLGWLVPDLLPLDIQRPLLPPHTLRSNLSPEKYINAQMNKQAYPRHKQCSTYYHLIKEYQKQTSLENKQSFKGS